VLLIIFFLPACWLNGCMLR